MYLNIDGFNKINDRIERGRQQELDNQRRATQDARSAQVFERQQKQWGLEDAEQAEVANQAGQLGGLASAKGYDWRRVAGVPEEEVSGGLAAPTNRAAIDQYTPPAEQSPAGLASGKVLAPAKKPSVANPMDDELAQIQNMAKLAAATRDPKQLAQAQAAFFDHKKRRTAMEMSEYFDKATPDELSRMAGAITADSTNKVKAVYDKDSGFTRLETDDGVQTLRPAELKKYLIAKAIGNIDGMAAAQRENIARTDKENATTEKMVATNNSGEYRSGLVEAKQAVADAKKAAGASGQPTREERLRYTSLFSEAGRRIAENQKALSTLQRDPIFMMNAKKPGTEESKQLQELRDAIKSHNEERSLYQGLLAGSQTGLSSATNVNTPVAPSGAAPGYQNEAAMRTTVAGDMGLDPAALQREIAATTKSLATVTDASSRAQLQAHLNDLTRQGKSAGVAAPQAKASAPSGKQDYSNLWK